MLLTLIAWRNLWRRTRRTLLTVGTVSLGLALMMISLGIGDGSHRQMIDSAVKMGSGHLLFQEPGYEEKREIDTYLNPDETEKIELWIRSRGKDLGIETFVRRVFASGLASSADGSTGIQIIGVQPEKERSVSLFDQKIVEGTFFKNSETAVIGQGVARKLEVTIGDRVVLMAQGAGSRDIQSVMVRVGGVLATGLEDVDHSLLIIDLQKAQKFLKMGPAIHQVAAFLEDERLTSKVVSRARDALPDIEILGWSDALPELRDAIVVDDGGNYVFQFFIFLLIAFTVMNTLLMSVLERAREFSLLDSLGLTPGKRFWMVMLEGVFISVLSAFAGFVLGYSLHLYFHYYGLPLDLFYSGQMSAAGVIIDPVLYSDLSVGRILGALGVVFGLNLILALMPAVRASKDGDVHLLTNH
jgi:ABC-type lipoprotein release transport system permease subunit